MKGFYAFDANENANTTIEIKALIPLSISLVHRNYPFSIPTLINFKSWKMNRIIETISTITIKLKHLLSVVSGFFNM
jgi:hypothetical protein